MPKSPAQFFLSLTPDLAEYLQKKLKDTVNEIIPDVVDIKKLKPDTEVLGVFVDSKITKTVLNKLPNLKLILAFSTGYDHIDMAEAKRRKIAVCTVPSYGDYTVAQHTLTLILALSRKLFDSVKRVKEGCYDYHGMRGFDLQGKTIGVIGTGKIGLQLIKMLSGFEMKVVAYDPFPKRNLAKIYNFSYVTLDKLLTTADIITIHTPLTPQTKHLLNKKTIQKTKRGVYIINTSRGGVIDGAALLAGLQSGQVAGAGLDVLENEEIMRDPVLIFSQNQQCDVKISLVNGLLIDHPNTIVTPHNAFNTTEAIHRIIDTSLANLTAWKVGRPQNLVSLDKPGKKR